MDAAHQALLAACQRLKDCAGPDAGGFDEALAAFKAQVRQHLQDELAQLQDAEAAEAAEAAEDQRAECEDFERFAEDVMSPDKFNRNELQQFATLWTLGHIHAADLAADTDAPG